MKLRPTLPFLCLCLLLSACKKQTFQERVREEADAFNAKDAGRQVDDVTRLDSMTFDEATFTLTQHHTLMGVADNAGILSDEVREKNRENLLQNLRNSINLRDYKKHGLIFRYTYYSEQSGELLIDEIFPPADYDAK